MSTRRGGLAIPFIFLFILLVWFSLGQEENFAQLGLENSDKPVHLKIEQDFKSELRRPAVNIKNDVKSFERNNFLNNEKVVEAKNIGTFMHPDDPSTWPQEVVEAKNIGTFMHPDDPSTWPQEVVEAKNIGQLMHPDD